jgi:ABC-type phosphate transport system ATPase subunit
MANQPTHHIEQRESRELASREADGLHVQLLWNPVADEVSVAVDDLRAGQRFDLPVARKRALDAFYHPFAYAA